jgi:predicted ATPase
MQLAAPWTIVLDAALAARLATRFEFTPLRPVRLKGKQDLIDICDVVGSRAAGSHGHAGLLSEPLLPIYGRDRELALAFATVDSALGGAARVLAVSGEPGIGKSVFLSHVAQRWHAAGGTVCHISVLHYERGAFTLWAKWLAELLQLDPGATPEQRAAHFTSTVAAIDPALAEWTPLWGELLDLDLPESPILRSLDRPSRYQRLADLTPLLLAGIARRQPLLLLGDDLHWADSASVELLDHVVPLLKDVPFLICVGFRPTEVTTFGLLSAQQCQTIPLQALADSASDALIRDALAGQAIAAEDQARFAAAVNELAGGNPFFIAELLSTLRAAGGLEAAIAGAGGSAPLSYNLQSLIMARLDTLDSRLREVVLAASVVGGQFSDDMIRPLLPASVAETLGYAAFSPLNQLHELDLLRPEIEPGAAVRARPTYRFRHALIQQVAYESLPFARRRLLHEEVGRHFEAHDHQSATADELLERLAYHYERSTNDQKAVLYLARSAERSARLFANTESLHQYQAALARAQQAAGRTTPNPAELLFELGNVQAQTADFPAALASYDQALLEIASADPFERPHLERRRAEVLVRATRFDEAQVAIERIERHLEQLAADAPRAVVNRSRLGQAQLAELRSTILMRQADFESASQWAEQGLKLLEGAVGRQPKSAITKIKLYQALAAPAAMLQRMDVAVHSISRALRLIQKQEDPVLEGQLQLRLAILAMQQDQLQRARPFFQRALPMIERTGARDRLAYTLLPGGETFLYRGEYQQAEQWIQRGLGLAEEVGTPFLICAAHSLLGWVQTVLGHWDSALDHFAQGTHLAQQHGLWDRYTEYLSRQGELLFYRGKIRDAEEMVLEAIKCAEDHALPRSIIVSQRVLAKIYYKQHRFDLAAPCLRQIMDKTDEDTALVLGEWWAKTTLSGQPVDSLLPVDEIQRRAEAALTFFQTRGFKLFVPTARRVNGLIAWAQNRPADAIRHFNRGLMLARASGHIPETVRLLVVRSQFKRASGASGGSATIRRDLSEAAALLRYLGAQPELDLVAQMLS